MKKTVSALLAALLLAGCGARAEMKTEETLRTWSELLKLFYVSGYGHGPEFPKRLLDVKDLPGTERPPAVDGWGQELKYRRVDGDTYQLISAGPDQKMGNDDDMIFQNGMQYTGAKIYPDYPFDKVYGPPPGASPSEPSADGGSDD